MLYKEKYAFIGLSQEEITQLLMTNDLFFSTTDDTGDDFKPSPTSRTIKKMAYLSSDETRDDIHPCAYTVKMQTHRNNTPTCKDILQRSSEEQILWDAAMVKEWKRDQVSFCGAIIFCVFLSFLHFYYLFHHHIIL